MFSLTGGASWRRVLVSGVTLLELLFVMALFAVLLVIGLPLLKEFHARAVVENQYQQLTSSLRLARSAALTRRELVTVCARGGSDDADKVAPGEGDGNPRCVVTDETDWSAGWLVFVDRGETGVLEDGDVVIAVHQSPANAGGAVGTVSHLSYRASGELKGIAAHIRFLPPGAPVEDEPAAGAVLVCINKVGRPRVTGKDSCRG